MIDYVCPNDGRKFFEAEAPVGVVIKTKCKTCKLIVEPVGKAGKVWHCTYECERCERKQHVENPKHERAVCVVCGTRTLRIIDEVRAVAPEAVLVRH